MKLFVYSNYEKIYSHPNKLLVKHLNGVFNNMQIILNSEYSKDLIYLTAYTHDFGKINPDFQNYLFNKNSNRTTHAEISALFNWFISNKINKISEKEKLFSFLSVYGHHSGIKNVDEITDHIEKNEEKLKNQLKKISLNKEVANSEIYSKFFNIKDPVTNFIEELSNFDIILDDLEEKVDKISFSEEDYIKFRNFFSALIFADRLDASNFKIEDLLRFTKQNFNHKEILEYIKTNYDITKGINKVRWKILENLLNKNYSSKKIYSLMLPTGAGKTLISLSIALKNLEKNNNLKKIIYVIPFINIINQTSKKFKEIFNTSSGILEHHHLSLDFDKQDEIPEDLSWLIYQSLSDKIVVTTMISFFDAIFGSKTKTLFKFSTIKNSIIIFDEIQSIPPKYYEITKYILKKLTENNNMVILMSATIPKIFINMSDFIKINENFQNYFIRNEYKFLKLDSKFELLDQIHSYKNKNIIVISNTVVQTQSLFKEYIQNYLEIDIQEFEEKIKEKDSIFWIETKNKIIACINTYQPPYAREKIIEKIKSLKNKNFVLFSTQVIEAGVDIDSEILFREIAPIDSIIQAAGRCNRNLKIKNGKVFIFEIKEETMKKANMVYSKEKMKKTKELIEELSHEFKNWTDREFITYLENFYEFLEKSTEGYFKSFKEKLKSIKIKNAIEDIKLIKEIPKNTIFIKIDDELLKNINKLIKIKEENIKNILIKRKIYAKISKYAVNVFDKDVPKCKLISNFCVSEYNSTDVTHLRGVVKKSLKGPFIF